MSALAGRGARALAAPDGSHGHMTRHRLGRDSLLIAGRHLRVLRMNPGRLIYPVVQPLVLLLLFVSVFGNLAVTTAAAAGTYRQFLIPGVIIQNAALTAPVTGLSLLRDARSGIADRFRSLPMSRPAVLLGRLASDGVIFVAQAALLVGAGRLLGFRITGGLPAAAGIIATAAAFGLAMATASACLALLINDAETAERVLYFPAIAIAFVSSAFAPVADLAGWMQPIARASPVTAAADLIRSLAGTPLAAGHLAAGEPAGPALLHLACWVAGLAVIPGVIAIRRWQSSP